MEIQVINKNKNGVTFKILGLPTEYGRPRDTATWEEFNETFEKTDKEFIFKTNAEFDRKIKVKEKIFSSMMPHVMAMAVSDDNMKNGKITDDVTKWMTSASMMAHYREEYQKEFGGSPADFIREYKVYEKTLLEAMMSNGCGIGEVHTRRHKFRDDKWSDEKRNKINETQKKNTFKSETFTLGDMLKNKGQA